MAINLAFQNVLGAPHFGINKPRIFVHESTENSFGRYARKNLGPRKRSGDRSDVLPDSGTVTTKWDLKTNEELGNAICVFKLKYESVTVVVAVSFSFYEIEIKGRNANVVGDLE